MTEKELPTEKASEEKRALYRVRLTYARRDALRYTSHLDMQLVWERTLRRAEVPLAYSQGFTPRPRLHLAAALPLGFLSRSEMVDFWLSFAESTPPPELDKLISGIRCVAPPGVEVLSGEFIPLSQPALQVQVQSAEYLACPLDAINDAELARAVNAVLKADTLPRERVKKPGSPGKPYDLRPLVEALEIQHAEEKGKPGLFMRLAAREGATGRPEELLAALGFESAAWRIERTRLILAS